MANEYPKEYGDFLNLLSQAGLEPVLDDDGNITTVESTLEFQGYQTQTVPKLQELIAHFQMPKMLTITWQTDRQSWKTVVTQDRVVTVLGQTYTDKEES
jgi:hypothetical protein